MGLTRLWLRAKFPLYVPDPDLDGVRPSTAGEEELQLQIAIALSKEEAQKEDEMRKGDEARLQLAVRESRNDSVSDDAGPSKVSEQFLWGRMSKEIPP